MKYTAAVLLALAANAAEIKLPPPYQTPSTMNRPKVVPQPGGVQLKVPAGFDVKPFADGFQKPRIMLLGPSGEILLSDTVKGGAVWAIRPEPKKKLIDNLDRPFGMAFWKDYLYVAESTSIKRYKYDSKSLSAGAGEEIYNMKDFGAGHITRAILFDKAGKKLYVGVGSGSDSTPGDPPERAAINRMDPDGGNKEIFASGLRNPTQLRWIPGNPTLWVTVQERDGLGDGLVPDFFTHVEQGKFYGWPYAYLGAHEDPRNKGLKPDLVKSAVEPDLLLGPHVAVLDFLFYTGKQFPKEYQNGAFLAFHGSSNRADRVGYSVGFIPFKNGKPSGKQQEFLTGWMMASDKVEVWGRPVGLLQMKDGSLLVSEDGNNKVWQISYTGKK
ncbi:MAG: sorbosone dehydrogenase family protein [Bryobacterales bacterium]|nr:sorbosone dehydrogenase family protein [Bryobacterales bacterium]